MDLNAGQLWIKSGWMQWTNGVYEESWTFAGTTLSEMPTPVALPTSHHFHPSISPIVSLSLGILHEWVRTGGDHRGGCAQRGWRTIMNDLSGWILGYMKLEIWRKIGLSGCLCTELRTRSGACYYWIGKFYCPHALLTATSGFGLGRRCWSSSQECYLHCVLTALCYSEYSVFQRYEIVNLRLTIAKWQHQSFQPIIPDWCKPKHRTSIH